MNRKRASQLLVKSMGLFNEPSLSQMESAGDRALARLATESATAQAWPANVPTPAPALRRPLRLLAAGIAIAVIALAVRAVFLRDSAVSTVSMQQIAAHQPFYSDGKVDKTLVLPDNSRVEMRIRTELSFGQAPDGLRILLKEGSILVYAAKQRTGHLYVQT